MKRLTLLSLLAVLPAWTGPVEFGMEEVKRAIADRGLGPRAVRFQAEVTADPPETYRILPGRITGGDLRGLMYGLLEAAEQIRERGRLSPARGTPATPIRGIRYFVHNDDLEKNWYYSRDYWQAFLGMLARNRFNRFNLVFAHQTAYLAPPYPYWIHVPEFPEVRVPGLTAQERDRNLEMLRYISQSASEHGIDFTLGIWEHNIQTGMKPSVTGLTRQNIGPYSHAALSRILALCPAIRSIQMRTNSESGIPADQQVEFYRDWVYRALREAGRRVTLDLRGWLMSAGMMDAARNAGVPLRLSSKYWAEHIGRPYQPAETWPNYSFINFLEKPRSYDFYFEVWGLGSHRLLLWGNPEFVRRAVPTFSLSGASGFEIDPPLAQKGFGNRPGRWGVFTEREKDRGFWKWEFERYWMFYLLWGRLSYDPKTPASVWTSELRRRFGAAAPEVAQAYEAASGVLGEIVAAHLADPNMYIWPEVNPGGLIDAYREVLPSDWRYIASIPEAVRNRAGGVASAKQTPADTAARLNDLAVRVEQAVERAAGKLDASHREWRSSEPDFRVLALLARYHARKQTAADQLEWFYQTGDPAGLETAKREIAAAIAVWEKLAAFTDGLYPAEMAFGPDDVGHWKDRLVYARHDLALIEERERIFREFGRFDFGFDFGGQVREPRGLSYRNDPYVLRHTVEPRFQAVDPDTLFSGRTGFGWVQQGGREAAVLSPTPYLEIRAAVANPKRLPGNALFGDSIRGRGRQVFRVRAGDGEYQVITLRPDGSTATATLRSSGGVLDIEFPDGEWNVSGLVVKGPRSREAPPAQKWPRPLARPAFYHVPPRTAPAGRPLSLALGITPGTAVTAVRLHYRPLNHLAQFKTLEAKGGRWSFTIPATDIPPQWDLMYYFEILNRELSGWFHPDPAAATPYFVVPVETAKTVE